MEGGQWDWMGGLGQWSEGLTLGVERVRVADRRRGPGGRWGFGALGGCHVPGGVRESHGEPCPAACRVRPPGVREWGAAARTWPACSITHRFSYQHVSPRVRPTQAASGIP